MVSYSLLRRVSNCIKPLPPRAYASPALWICSVAGPVGGGDIIGSSRIGSHLHLSTSSSSTEAVEEASTATTVKKKKYKRNKQQSVDQYCSSYLIRILNSEIKFARNSDFLHCAVDIPRDFPFTVQDDNGGRTIVLKRKFQEETITVVVDMPTSHSEEYGDDGDRDSEPCVGFVAIVSKADDWFLQFDGIALPGRILVDGLSIKKSGHSRDELRYEGPDFLKLNENFRKAIYDYLEIRGMTSSTINFVLEYMISKDAKEYLRWLRNLTALVEQK